MSSTVKATLWVTLAGCIAVTLIDTGGSLFAKATGTPYEYWAIPSYLLYAAVGVIAAHRRPLAAAAVAGLVVCVFDLTVGWWISWQIGPGRLDLSGPLGVHAMIITVIISIPIVMTVVTVAGAIWQRIIAGRDRSSMLASGNASQSNW